MHAHWTDSDGLNNAAGSNLIKWADGQVSQYGEPPPQRFRERVSP